MIVLDLFSGIATARLALERLGIVPSLSLASETDKNAIKVAKHRYPDILHLGDVNRISYPRHVDLLIGGPPCQPFSVGGKRRMFSDPRASLLRKFIEIKDAVKPTWFLMENVSMPIGCINEISDAIGVDPIWLDSAAFSAQRRLRAYWTNIPVGRFPEPSKVTLGDILEEDQGQFSWRESCDFCETLQKRIEGRILRLDQKAYTLCKNSRSLGASGMTTIQRPDGKFRMLTVVEAERLQTLPDHYTAACTYHTIRRALIGNAFTAKVIEYILGHIQCINSPSFLKRKTRTQMQSSAD